MRKNDGRAGINASSTSYALGYKLFPNNNVIPKKEAVPKDGPSVFPVWGMKSPNT